MWLATVPGLCRFQPENSASVCKTYSAKNDLCDDVFALAEDKDGNLWTGSSCGAKKIARYGFTTYNVADGFDSNHINSIFENSAGEYRFEVRAQTADRILSSPASVSFKIATPFWQKWWFATGLAVLAFFLVYVFSRYRLARLLEIERMRTRIATDLHDDIGSNLTKISVLSEVVNQKLSSGTNGFDGGKLLENIAETSRESVSAMSDIVWAINPKKDSLADLTTRMRRHAEEILERREIRLRFDAPPVAPDLNLNADVRRNIYLIFKESLNNIVRHSEASKVEIDFRLEGGKLILSIADDGRGFDKTEDFDGNGLLNMKKRAAELKGNLRIDSACEGTTVILVLSTVFRQL